MAAAKDRNWRWWTMLSWALMCLGSFVTSMAQEHPSLHGSIEEYDWARQEKGKLLGRQRAIWIRGELTLNSAVTVVSTWLKFYSRKDMLDENYIGINIHGVQTRTGRIRPKFGFNDWEENWYVGFVRPPLVKMQGLSSDVNLLGFVSGFEATAGTPEIQITGALVDPTLDSYQWEPRRMDASVVRLQGYRSGIILGLNSLSRGSRPNSPSVSAYGLDLRYTVPQWQFRGEVIHSKSGGMTNQGYYADAFFKPFGAPKTTFLGRIERAESDSPNMVDSHLVTLGVKQVLTPWLQLDVLHSWGNHGTLSENSRGWTFQIITFIRF